MSQRLGLLWFVLDEGSRERLRRAVPAMYPKDFYHHVTLRYGVSKHEMAEWIGKSWTIKAYAVAHNAQAQACRVETNGLPDEYGVPHVTISTARGIAPFASVAMLQGQHHEEPLASPIELSGTIEFEYIDNVKD